METKENKKPIYIKYLLHKDKSPIWDIVYNKEDAKKKIQELKANGYKPFIDTVTFKNVKFIN